MLAMTPEHSEFISSSEVCASCHTIKLPVLDKNNNVIKLAFEQTTYLEWVNSSFAYDGGELTTCQDCHMPQTYEGDKLDQFQIANIQDQTFPDAAEIIPSKERTVATRENYSRHTLSGINVFGLEMFRRQPSVWSLVEPRVALESDADGFDRMFHLLGHEAHHEGRIQPAA